MAQDHYAYLTHVRRLFRIKYGVHTFDPCQFHSLHENEFMVNKLKTA